MIKFPQIPPLHRCRNRGWSRVYALLADIHGPRGSVIPMTFITDGVSIPWYVRYTIGLFFRFVRWKFKKGLASGINHDYGYAIQQKPRGWYDLRYYRDMRMEGFTKWQARTIYKAVREKGDKPWDENKTRSHSYFFCEDHNH